MRKGERPHGGEATYSSLDVGHAATSWESGSLGEGDLGDGDDVGAIGEESADLA